MSIPVRCPNGHRLKVPDEYAGKSVRCPRCRQEFAVPGEAAVKDPEDVGAGGINGLVVTPFHLILVAAGWVASLLLAVLLGAFIAGSPETPPHMSDAGLAGDDQVGTSAVAGASNTGSVSANTSETSVSGAQLDKQNRSSAHPLGVEPTNVAAAEAGSGTVVSSRRWNRPAARPPGVESRVVSSEAGSGTISSRRRSNRYRPGAPPPDWAAAERAGASMAAQPAVRMSKKEAVESLLADLKEAASMLEKGQHRLLSADFLTPAYQAQNMRRRSSRNQALTNEELQAHLEAALIGTRIFNRNFTLVEIRYVRQAEVVVPAGPPYYVPEMADKPRGTISGLGSDLPTMLTKAAGLLEADKVEEFIRNVYPLAELAQLSEADSMERMILRVSSIPDMKSAMIQDLKDCAAADHQITGAEASVLLPPLVPGDRDRVLKFQRVDGNWRFFDGGQKTRAAYRKLVVADVPSVTQLASAGVIVLSRQGENWRLTAPPVTQSVN